MRKHGLALMLLSASVAFANPVLADSDPTMQQIYDQARSGHVDQAQQMINQVLRDHPRSAKAHYVAAELAAKQGNLGSARAELAQAEQLDPGLPFAKPQSVQALKAELGLAKRSGALVLAPAPAQHSIPWVAVLTVLGIIALIWMVVRRRSAAPGYSAGGPFPGGGMPAAGGGPAPYGGPAGYGAPAGGIGSGIAGGLASGLAVGAGVVAGEELARHFLDGGRRESMADPGIIEEPPVNTDMGGSDFGINDPGSWDDSGGGGGGGDDWT